MEIVILSVIVIVLMGFLFYVIYDNLKERKRLELYIMKMENPIIGRSVEDKKGMPKVSKLEKVKNKRRKTYNEILNSSTINKEQLKIVGAESHLV